MRGYTAKYRYDCYHHCFAIKDTVDSVFDVTAVARGAEIENIITISKIRGMMPKARVVRLAQRETGLATETIRRGQ